jgi:hypothetical protein
MERDVVLSHELHQLHLLRVLPPLFPFWSVVGCDGEIPNGRIEPDVKDLVLKAF